MAHFIQHPQLLKRPDDELEPAKFTFSPQVSEKSLRIVERMKSTFLSRQQAVIERRRMLVSLKPEPWMTERKAGVRINFSFINATEPVH